MTQFLLFSFQMMPSMRLQPLGRRFGVSGTLLLVLLVTSLTPSVTCLDSSPMAGSVTSQRSLSRVTRATRQIEGNSSHTFSLVGDE